MIVDTEWPCGICDREPGYEHASDCRGNNLDEMLSMVAIQNRVIKFFNGDRSKTREWFATPNPRFGMISPSSFTLVKGVAALRHEVDTMLAENSNE